jgi:hypothetical protein
MRTCALCFSMEACSFHAVTQETATCSQSVKYSPDLLYRFNGERMRNRKSTRGKNDNETEEKD